MSWKIIPQGCLTSPNLRTLIQGSGYGHVLITGLPAEVRARVAAVVVAELEEIEHDQALDALNTAPIHRPALRAASL